MKNKIITALILLALITAVNADGNLTATFNELIFHTDFYQSDDLAANDSELRIGYIIATLSENNTGVCGACGAQHRDTLYEFDLHGRVNTDCSDGSNYFCDTIPSGQQYYYLWADCETPSASNLMAVSGAETTVSTCTEVNDTYHTFHLRSCLCINETDYNACTPPLILEVANYQVTDTANLNQSYWGLTETRELRNYADNNGYMAQRYAISDTVHTTLNCQETTTTTTTLPTGCQQNIIVKFDNGSSVSGATVNLIGPATDPGDNIEQTNGSGYAIYNDLECGVYSELWASYVPVLGDQYPNAKYLTDIDVYHPNEDIIITLQRFVDKFYFNATFNIFDYGNLNMAANNKVSLFACADGNKCNPGQYDALRSYCDRLGENTTSHEGIMRFYNLATLKPYLCAMTQYIHYDAPTPPQVTLWPTDNMLGYYNIDFNFTYGIDVQEFEVCLGFIDSVTRLPLTGVNVSIADAQNILDMEKSGTITGQYHCWNTTKVEDDGTTAPKILTAFKTNYFPIRFQLITPRVGNNDFPLQPLPHNVTTSYRYYMGGASVDADLIGVGNLYYAAVCVDHLGGTYTIRNKTNSTGGYQVTNIIDGSECCVRVTDTGYDSTEACRTVGANLTNVNITVTASDGDLVDVDFQTVSEGIYIGSYDPVPYAGFTITCPGYYTRPLVLTGGDGHVIVKDLRRDCVHNYIASKDGFLDTPGSFTPTTRAHQIIMQDEGGTCVVEGYTYNNTVGNPLTADMTLLRSGAIVNTLQSSQLGYYRFQVECGVRHTIQARYEDQIQTENVRVQATEEGNSISQNFIFKEAEITWKEDINDFTSFLRLMLPLFYIGAFMFVMLMIYLMAKKFGGTNFMTEIIVVVIIILSVVLIVTLLELVAFLLETLG